MNSKDEDSQQAHDILQNINEANSLRQEIADDIQELHVFADIIDDDFTTTLEHEPPFVKDNT